MNPEDQIEVRSTEDGRISIHPDDWHRWNEAQRQIGEARVARHSLRDEYAKAALQVTYERDSPRKFREEAELAFQLADAMLEARDAKGDSDG